MDANRAAGRLRERGVTSVQFLLASALGLLLFLALANLVIVQYGRGAIRSALDQGARVGAITGSVSVCEAKIAEVLDQLLGGTMGDAVTSRCVIEATSVAAHGGAEFVAWTPLTTNFVVDLTARAALERPP